jgi:xanthine dehydrogenase accessory factor
MDNKRIFAFLRARIDEGRDCILVTVLSAIGSSMRGPGAHMAVCGDGRFTGSLSGGCIENAVVAEAMSILAKGAPGVTRFGTGSPYIDIRLPCGGGLDIHFLPLYSGAAENKIFVGQCADHIAQRQPFSLILPLQSGNAQCLPSWQPMVFTPGGEAAAIGHWPVPRVMIVGHGAAAEILAQLAAKAGLDVNVATPDAALAARLAAAQADHVPVIGLLSSPRDIGALQSDHWTAIAFLFHDHDWESHLMAHALTQPHFYCGAMGGRMAHAARRDSLAALGVSPEKIDSIHAPIGLYHSARDPENLALSALAQIMAVHQLCDFSRGHDARPL